MIFNIQHTANWEYIKQRKQQIIDNNNRRENATRKEHIYSVGDKVLLRRGTAENKYEAPFSGPYKILHVNDYGTVRLMLKSVEDTYNMRLVPYHSETDLDHGGECNMRTSRKRR